MCLNCGCGMFHDDMGNQDNITIKTLAKAAKVSHMNGKDTLENVKRALQNLKPEEIDKEIDKLNEE